MNKIQRDILAAIEILVGPRRNRYVADYEVAGQVGLTVQQVRDYLDLLEAGQYVSLAKTFGGYAALTTARGRMALQDPDALRDESQDVSIVFSGDLHNVNLNIASTLTDVSQTINAQMGSNPALEEVQQLIEQLKEILQQAPQESAEDAEAIAQATESFVKAAVAEKPNKRIVEITREGLQKAAQNIASVMPTVLTIVNQIIATVMRLRQG